MDSYVEVESDTAEVACGVRLRSTVGAAIVVDGRLWGALMAATRGVEPLPEDAETRIAAFTELVATAVSNAQAREDLHRLADEQVALRRVATLVDKEAAPAEVFAKVAEEALELAERDVASPGGVTGAPLGGLANVEQHRAGTHETVGLPRADSLARAKQRS
jgi:GAF domain-containing protein